MIFKMKKLYLKYCEYFAFEPKSWAPIVFVSPIIFVIIFEIFDMIWMW